MGKQITLTLDPDGSKTHLHLVLDSQQIHVGHFENNTFHLCPEQELTPKSALFVASILTIMGGKLNHAVAEHVGESDEVVRVVFL